MVIADFVNPPSGLTDEAAAYVAASRVTSLQGFGLSARVWPIPLLQF